MRLGRRFLWIAGSITACLVVFLLVFAAYRFNWTGAGFLKKTFWDWLQLLIIPFALAIIAFSFNRVERKNEQLIASDNQQEAALQAYLDKMSELLLKDGLRESKLNAEVRSIARARTLTVLRRLDANRKVSLLRFLYESGLIDESNRIIDLDGADLHAVDLHDVKLTRAALCGVDLSGADLRTVDLYEADLENANLSNANLSGAYLLDTCMLCADLQEADLRGADLQGAKLERVKLEHADLFKASPSFLEKGIPLQERAWKERTDKSKPIYIGRGGTNLCRANLGAVKLNQANLKKAHMDGADLGEANLREADLREAIFTTRQMERLIQENAVNASL